MYKSIWARVLACLAVVVLLSLSVLPLMASAESDLSGDAWIGQSSNFTPFYTLSSSLEGVLSAEIVETFTEAVEAAYHGGMFGGGVPVAVGAIPVYDATTSTNVWSPAVIVAFLPYFTDPTQNIANASPSKLTIDTWLEMSMTYSTNYGYEAKFSNTYNWPFATWTYTITDSGDLAPYSQFSFAQYNGTGSAQPIKVEENLSSGLGIRQFRFWAFRSSKVSISGVVTDMYTANAPQTEFAWFYNDNSNEMLTLFDTGNGKQWIAPAPEIGGNAALLSFLNECKRKYYINSSTFDDGYEEGRDEGYAEGREQGFQSGYDEGYDAGFDPGYRQGYDDGYTEGSAGIAPVVLDIPSIFSAMFSGVHSIFQGFDINIFGISIAGMLLGILLVVLVAFMVKKLK